MPDSNPSLPVTDRPDYSGPFDPDFRYEDLSKEALVRLVREENAGHAYDQLDAGPDHGD